jgi:hypothetical protein
MSVPKTDKQYSSVIISAFDGDPALGTFDSMGTAIALPLQDWVAHAYPMTIGPFSVQAFTAEWLTLAVELADPTGVPTTVTMWLAGEGPGAITETNVTTYSVLSDGKTAVFDLGSVSTALDLSGGQGVFLRGKTDTGTVDVKFIELTYSPK